MGFHINVVRKPDTRLGVHSDFTSKAVSRAAPVSTVVFYPPLKLMVASVTTSAALMLGGVALTVLPTMVVGNELLILGVVALVVGGCFPAHRHGTLRGMVGQSPESKVKGPKSGNPASRITHYASSFPSL